MVTGAGYTIQTIPGDDEGHVQCGLLTCQCATKANGLSGVCTEQVVQLPHIKESFAMS